jgi:hypothetical protein
MVPSRCRVQVFQAGGVVVTTNGISIKVINGTLKIDEADVGIECKLGVLGSPESTKRYTWVSEFCENNALIVARTEAIYVPGNPSRN